MVRYLSFSDNCTWWYPDTKSIVQYTLDLGSRFCRTCSDGVKGVAGRFKNRLTFLKSVTHLSLTLSALGMKKDLLQKTVLDSTFSIRPAESSSWRSLNTRCYHCFLMAGVISVICRQYQPLAGNISHKQAISKKLGRYYFFLADITWKLA